MEKRLTLWLVLAVVGVMKFVSVVRDRNEDIISRCINSPYIRCVLEENWSKLLPERSYVLLLGDSHLRATWSGFGQIFYSNPWRVNMSQYHQPHLICCYRNGTCEKEVGGVHFFSTAADHVRIRLRQRCNCFLWMMTPLPKPDLLSEYFSALPKPDLVILNFGLHMLFRAWNQTLIRDSLSNMVSEIDKLQSLDTVFSFHSLSWPEPLKWKTPAKAASLPDIFRQYEAMSNDQRELLQQSRVEIVDATSLTRFSPLFVNKSLDGTHYPAIYGSILALADASIWLRRKKR